MNNAVSGGLRVVLRLEGFCILVASVLAYAKFGMGWSTFAWFFLAPDASFAGYLAGSKIGAIAYNVAHSLIGALMVLLAGVLMAEPTLLSAGLIWTAHIGFDRALGYGLKYSVGFKWTHLGMIGHQRSDTESHPQ